MPITDEVREKIRKQGDDRLTALKQNTNHITRLLNKDEETSYNTGYHTGIQEGYSLALAELLTKGESNSPWIKASERLPEFDKKLSLKWKGTPCVGQFVRGHKENLAEIERRGTYLEPSFIYIEWFDEEKLSRMVAELEALKKENERLNQWKKEAMPMMEDFQAIGKALGIPLGQSIHEKILPGITSLQKENERLKGLVRVAHDTGFVTGFNADKSKPRIQNAWDEFKQQHNL